MKQLTLLLFSLLLGLTAVAQNADKLYEEGKALYDAKDYAKAFPKLKAAAEKGHKKAQYRLGRCYDKGHGTEKDKTLAFKWYSKAADQGSAKALYQLGKCYKEGEGVAKDHTKAVSFFSKAARQENADARYQLAKYYLKGKGGLNVDPKKAKSLIKQAVSDEKDGKEIREKLREDASNGDDTARQLLEMLK